MPVKRTTCTDFFKKKKNHSLHSATTFRNLQQPDLLLDRFDSWVVKRATSLFSSFCSNGTKQVAAFCCTLYCTLKEKIFNDLQILMGSTNVRVGSTIFSARQPKQPSSANAAGGIP